MTSKIDSKGRVYIPKSMRKKLTRDVYLVKRNINNPKAQRPYKRTEANWKKLPEKSIEELKKI